MTKQDRAAKKQAAAANEAGRIIEQAKATARAKAASPSEPSTEPAKPKRGRGLTPELADHAAAVKEARDAGTAWWRIAFDLGLPGSADTVAKGKAGAGLARRIYAAAYGELPARPVSARTLRKATEKNEDVKALRAQRQSDRQQSVRRGDAVINPELDDEAVINMLRGRVITWSINLASLDGGSDSYSDDSSQVHPRFMRIEHHGGERCIAFREMDMHARSADARSNPGPTRIVRLSRIHTVR